MAIVQKQFRQFHEAIKLTNFDENDTLRRKRDIVLEKLRARRLPATFDHLNQGSYALHTGIQPTPTGDYDIDVGLMFNIARDGHDPLQVKKWVYEALEGHTQHVEMLSPCVRVQYQEAGEPVYHVDLAVYAAGNSDGRVWLARGKLGSVERSWEEADPRGLIKAVTDRHAGEDREQFRRVIRALKRWKDVRFSEGGNAAPTGIALTFCAWQWFTPARQGGDYDDLTATRRLVAAMGAQIASLGRLRVPLPVAPRNDLLAKMTDRQMTFFAERLRSLDEALARAGSEPNPVEAYKLLRGEFGFDFPINAG